ncbi:DUF4244 domain-containing protein [Leucobacter komagatae]|uniref:DUF4244 domain-containing protein n=1 Tax=Leucobacter komagatae TaxID=55969 RepID=A0A0D0INY7_9MICO|nr:DUF4244 domain-containing protein [Leucobacter komagatae]KIP52787.1 hypothetical protein SD72_07550 [Leucobacter komagatae]
MNNITQVRRQQGTEQHASEPPDSLELITREECKQDQDQDHAPDQGQDQGQDQDQAPESEEQAILRSLGFPVAGAASAEPGAVRGPRAWFARARGAARAREFAADERGAVTAEYALVIMAAVAFAGLLIVIMRSEEVRSMLLSLVQNALGSAG